MSNEKLIKKWRSAIMKLCRERPGRRLTQQEKEFITSHGGFMALEMIEETVKSRAGPELEKYLNSGSAT